MKKFFILFLLSLCCSLNAQYNVSSPDGKLKITVTTGDKIYYSLQYNGVTYLDPSPVSLTLTSNKVLGKNPRVISYDTHLTDLFISSPFYIRSSVRDNYNELKISFSDNFGLIFRAYNDGAAYRFFSTISGNITVVSEEAAFRFAGDYKSYIPYSKSEFATSYENHYEYLNISAAKNDLIFLPVLIDAGGIKMCITESDINDYPGMFLRKSSGNAFNGMFAGYPSEEIIGGYDNNLKMVTKRSPFIAATKGTRTFPWRTIIISENDKNLADNDMVYRLAEPVAFTDISWIMPGKAAWDWWNNYQITDINFQPGMNTQTYKYYIDFAASTGLEYIIIDAGWSDKFNLFKFNNNVGLQEIVNYGKSKNVGVIIWSLAAAIENNMEENFRYFSGIGVKGFKIDFIERDDQKAINFYRTAAETAGRYNMVLSFHGANKPAGINRTFPNVLTIEAVQGMEYYKWDKDLEGPVYETMIPFIRMIAGPMDYTPGSLRNASRNTFKPVSEKPFSQGTRVRQLAMFVIYFSPLTAVAGSPSEYKADKNMTDFISRVPTVWNESITLKGSAGEDVIIARKKNDTWFIGGITNWNERSETIDLGFLGAGNYKADIYSDGSNASVNAQEYTRNSINVTGSSTLNIKMAAGGGWAAIISPR
jgi:alpha-glucosidase